MSVGGTLTSIMVSILKANSLIGIAGSSISLIGGTCLGKFADQMKKKLRRRKEKIEREVIELDNMEQGNQTDNNLENLRNRGREQGQLENSIEFPIRTRTF